MADGQFNNQLGELLNFGPDELRQNQQGQMSLQQRANLLSKIDFIPVFILIAVPIGVIGGGFAVMLPIQFVAVPLILIATAYLSRTSFKIIQSALNGQVLEASGVIEIRVYGHDRRTFLGILREPFANGIINGVSFLVPVEMAAFFQGKSMRVHYSQPFRQALSAELLAE